MDFKKTPASAINAISQGFNKQTNWEDQKWSDIISKIKTLINDFDNCIDFKGDEFIPSAIAVEAMKLIHLGKCYPINDDRHNRFKTSKQLRIGLDIDEVIADFIGHYDKRFNITSNPGYWNYSYKMSDNLNELISDKEFWLSIPKLRDVPFEPALYCTSRSIPIEWTLEWLEKNGFPCKPVISIPFGESKLKHLQEANIQMFVDDKVDTFKELNDNGIFTYLMDCAMNKYYDAGYKRIYDLKDIL